MCIFEEYTPKGILSYCVHSISYYDVVSDNESIQRILPDGSVYLTINLEDSPLRIYEGADFGSGRTYPNFWMSGMLLKHLTIHSPKHIRALVVKFKSIGAYPVLGIPMFEFINTVVDADVIFGNEIVSLTEDIIGTTEIMDKIHLVERWLYKRLKLEDPISTAVVQFAIDTTLCNPDKLNMKSIANKSGFTQQHFINIFKKYVGLTPKQYERIVRFNQILKRVNQSQTIDWSDLAFEVGYYDQSHLINDFKTFSGFSPEVYLNKAQGLEHHIPVG
ncbi:MAG: AraC family transcriptional regulator [Roseivirga sp.]|nr:AraC family transcriptional regulator [Roseivirga sp.]